jgi:hypothetical protein
VHVPLRGHRKEQKYVADIHHRYDDLRLEEIAPRRME